MTTHLRQVWDRGETALGAFLFLREPLIAEAAALAGYDYVCVDMQHGLQSFEHTVTMLYAMARTETTPIVRVPWNEPSIIGRVLDAGAYGSVMASNYNRRTLPPEVMVQDGGTAVIRRRQTIDDMLALET